MHGIPGWDTHRTGGVGPSEGNSPVYESVEIGSPYDGVPKGFDGIEALLIGKDQYNILRHSLLLVLFQSYHTPVRIVMPCPVGHDDPNSDVRWIMKGQPECS